MTKTTKRLETLSKNIIKIIREFNDIPTENLSILSKRLGLLKELSNALPVINELINQLELDEQNFSVGMTTED
jgi:hypothetical protein